MNDNNKKEYILKIGHEDIQIDSQGNSYARLNEKQSYSIYLWWKRQFYKPTISKAIEYVFDNKLIGRREKEVLLKDEILEYIASDWHWRALKYENDELDDKQLGELTNVILLTNKRIRDGEL